MDKNQLLTLITTDDFQKKELLASIEKSKKKLMLLIEKVTVLSLELETIRQEYNTRIARLYARDDSLDYEIIRYRTLKEFLSQGFSYAEALKKLEHHFINQKETQKEEETVFFPKDRDSLPDEEQKTLRKLWKSLITKFHPDLTLDKEEKKKRESLMKKINQAYVAGDLETLTIIEQEGEIREDDLNSLESLERMFIALENNIFVEEKKYRELRASEWFGWKRKKETLMKKKKKKNIDVFAELEDQLLSDIVRKVDILQRLKKEVN